MAAAASTAATDEQLVMAARAGSEEALEALYRRYRDRITPYVRGIVGDHGRAEDLVQETFISAFKSLRASEREIIFKPWIYQIARNACIDQLRRSKRAEEVSIDSEDFKPSEEGRLSETVRSTDAAVSQREDMDALTQAFGGLPPSQHEVLILREFEGLSYAEIGHRMHITPAAVESMLFRARRGLKDEYDEIATGERCRRIQQVIAAVAEGLGGSRDRRALARHVDDCSLCRQEAIAMGLGALIAAPRRSKVRSALHRAAAMLPFPWLFRRRRSGSSANSTSGFATRAQTALSEAGLAVGPAAEQAANLAPKVVAVVAAAALIGSGGMIGQKSSASIASSGAPGAGAPNGALGSAAQPKAWSPLYPGSALQGAASTGPPSAGNGSPGASGPLPGGNGPAGGLTLPTLPGAVNVGPLTSPSAGTPSLPSTVQRLGSTVQQAPGTSKLPGVRAPSLGGTSLPALGGGSGGGGGGVPSVSLPSVSPPPVKAPAVRTPRAPDTPTAPRLPSGPSGPSVPSAPSAPAVPDTSLDSVTNTLQGVTGTTVPVAPGIVP